VSKVLVADGDPERRARLTNLLRQAGHDATAVDNGTDALQVLRAGPCCLAVLDLELPGVGGLDLLREARAEGDRPVILIGPDCPESRRAAVLLGVDRYLVRPVAEALLLVAVRAVLRDCPDS
jgi:two-component system phosphate regulon response regulator PhoB